MSKRSYTLKNVSPGFRGILASDIEGCKTISSGETASFDLTEDELQDALSTGWFEIAKPEAPALAGKSKTELLAIADAEGVEADDAMKVAEIREAIEAAREG